MGWGVGKLVCTRGHRQGREMLRAPPSPVLHEPPPPWRELKGGPASHGTPEEEVVGRAVRKG
eukprot:scaffold4054_cov95-Isochrysis_galbana.AAC.2